jgi:hypothetical protein
MAIDFSTNFIIFRCIGDDTIVYQTQKNKFIVESGLTIENPDVNIPAYLLPLDQWGTSLRCGHIIDNIVGQLKNVGLENIILIVDFKNIVDISEEFCSQYFNFMLTTKSKIININQNTNINNIFVSYIDNVVEYQDEV